MTVRDNPLWPHPPTSAARRPKTPCQRAACPADTTGEVRYGHCLNCAVHVGAVTERQWHFKVRRPCPSCGRPW